MFHAHINQENPLSNEAIDIAISTIDEWYMRYDNLLGLFGYDSSSSSNLIWIGHYDKNELEEMLLLAKQLLPACETWEEVILNAIKIMNSV